MRVLQLQRPIWFIGVMILGLLIIGLAPESAAQPKDEKKEEKKDDTKQEVSFETPDGVILKGTYYRGPKLTESPVAILMPEYGKDRTKGDWNGLAKKLQEQNFAVLLFDLRGHGASAEVDPQKFWSVTANQRFIAGANPKRKFIAMKDFAPSYLPMLVQDLVGARRFVDQKNDERVCNSRNLFIVAAGVSCPVAFTWAASEWKRQSDPNGRMGGADIAACIWLGFTMNPTVKGAAVRFNFAELVKNQPEIREKTPQLFLYGAGNAAAMTSAKDMHLKILKVRDPKAITVDLTYEKDVGKTNLSGVDLLGKAELATEDLLVNKYIDGRVLQKRGSVAWVEHKVSSVPMFFVPLEQFGFPNLTR